MKTIVPTALRVSLLVVPALVLCVLYGILFPRRPDYLGHFAAGYGGTLAALWVTERLTRQPHFREDAPLYFSLTVAACAALGAVFEATVFRLAIFDVVDFCNQTLGAVLAGLAALAVTADRKAAARVSSGWIVAAFLLLAAGFRYAFR